ncbi:MAG: LicD family protein [Elusimicrobium sp.]|nr:LicD family protein [Elusimicrobium sp.]
MDIFLSYPVKFISSEELSEIRKNYDKNKRNNTRAKNDEILKHYIIDADKREEKYILINSLGAYHACPRNIMLAKYNDIFPLKYGVFEGEEFMLPANPDFLLKQEYTSGYMSFPYDILERRHLKTR